MFVCVVFFQTVKNMRLKPEDALHGIVLKVSTCI